MQQYGSSTNLIRVLLADDDFDIQKIVTDLLKNSKEIQLIGIAANGREAVAMYEELRPDILLLDLFMPVMNGVEAAGILRTRYPQIKILVMSSATDQESVEAMLHKEVDGYLSKGELPRKLTASIQTVFSGNMVFSHDVFSAHRSTHSAPTPQQTFGLTEREREVLNLLKNGSKMPEIAARLSIKQTTVRTHIENINKKLGVKTNSEMLVIAAKNGLI